MYIYLTRNQCVQCIIGPFFFIFYVQVGSINQFQWKVDFLSYLDAFPTLAPYLIVFHSVTQPATLPHEKQKPTVRQPRTHRKLIYRTYLQIVRKGGTRRFLSVHCNSCFCSARAKVGDGRPYPGRRFALPWATSRLPPAGHAEQCPQPTINDLSSYPKW